MSTKAKSKPAEKAPEPPALPTLVVAKTPVMRDAESVIEKVADGGALNPEDREKLQIAGFDGTKFRRAVSLAIGIRRHQREARTAAERQAAQNEIDAARAAEEIRKPELNAIIENANAELQQLWTAVRNAETAAQPMFHAVAALRTVHSLPSYIRDQYEDHRDQNSEENEKLRDIYVPQ